MRLFIAEHDAHWIGPGITVVVAGNAEKAREQVEKELPKHGLDPIEEIKIREIPIDQPYAETVWDGNY